MDAGDNSPGTLKTFFSFISRISNLNCAAGDYSAGTHALITLPEFTFSTITFFFQNLNRKTKFFAAAKIPKFLNRIFNLTQKTMKFHGKFH